MFMPPELFIDRLFDLSFSMSFEHTQKGRLAMAGKFRFCLKVGNGEVVSVGERTTKRKAQPLKVPVRYSAQPLAQQ